MRREEIVTYYREAGPDYETWSPEFNMHFGYWRWPLNPLRREPMLAQMNSEVLARLRLKGRERLLDMGCGVGATLRQAARQYPDLELTGVTLVPWQIETAERLNQRDQATRRIRLLCADYTATGLEPAGFDGIYALESSCHSEGADKRDFICELARLLKPGSRFCLADGFRRGSLESFAAPFRAIQSRISENWAVPEFAELTAFLDCLQEHGLVDLVVEDIGMRIGPSVLHSPWLVLRFWAGKALRGDWPNPVSRKHLIACLLSPALGLHPRFSYYLIHGRKRED